MLAKCYHHLHQIKIVVLCFVLLNFVRENRALYIVGETPDMREKSKKRIGESVRFQVGGTHLVFILLMRKWRGDESSVPFKTHSHSSSLRAGPGPRGCYGQVTGENRPFLERSRGAFSYKDAQQFVCNKVP